MLQVTNTTGPSHKAPARLGSSGLSLLSAPGKWGKKKEKDSCLTYSVTIIGFVGADPEQRQARNNNGSKFTVLSVATQRSWKNTDDEWASKTKTLHREERSGEDSERGLPKTLERISTGLLGKGTQMPSPSPDPFSC
jgi:Single-strand binding protein family